MNRVILIGNLATDPEGRTTQSGIEQSTFRLAVQRRYANAQGVREADFFTIVAWRQTATFCNRYLTKGRKIAIEGSLQARTYDGQDGQRHYVTEVIADQVEAVQSRRNNEDDPGPTPPPGSRQPEDRTEQQKMDLYGGEDFTEVDDDELPF